MNPSSIVPKLHMPLWLVVVIAVVLIVIIATVATLMLRKHRLHRKGYYASSPAVGSTALAYNSSRTKDMEMARPLSVRFSQTALLSQSVVDGIYLSSGSLLGGSPTSTLNAVHVTGIAAADPIVDRHSFAVADDSGGGAPIASSPTAAAADDASAVTVVAGVAAAAAATTAAGYHQRQSNADRMPMARSSNISISRYSNSIGLARSTSQRTCNSLRTPTIVSVLHSLASAQPLEKPPPPPLEQPQPLRATLASVDQQLDKRHAMMDMTLAFKLNKTQSPDPLLPGVYSNHNNTAESSTLGRPNPSNNYTEGTGYTNEGRTSFAEDTSSLSSSMDDEPDFMTTLRARGTSGNLGLNLGSCTGFYALGTGVDSTGGGSGPGGSGHGRIYGGGLVSPATPMSSVIRIEEQPLGAIVTATVLSNALISDSTKERFLEMSASASSASTLATSNNNNNNNTPLLYMGPPPPQTFREAADLVDPSASTAKPAKPFTSSLPSTPALTSLRRSASVTTHHRHNIGMPVIAPGTLNEKTSLTRSTSRLYRNGDGHVDLDTLAPSTTNERQSDLPLTTLTSNPSTKTFCSVSSTSSFTRPSAPSTPSGTTPLDHSALFPVDAFATTDSNGIRLPRGTLTLSTTQSPSRIPLAHSASTPRLGSLLKETGRNQAMNSGTSSPTLCDPLPQLSIAPRSSSIAISASLCDQDDRDPSFSDDESLPLGMISRAYSALIPAHLDDNVVVVGRSKTGSKELPLHKSLSRTASIRRKFS
ncbi:hypothetical protein BSLG_009250 [Batrachochytrium salamandrivorans]|nr:hypothetical protein BSLG_009250 [Batrachochytrium salamandrivorans]